MPEPKPKPINTDDPDLFKLDKVGKILEGVFTRKTMFSGNPSYPASPAIVVRQDDGKEVLLILGATILKRKVYAARPRRGERIRIGRGEDKQSKAGTKYHSYGVELPDRDDDDGEDDWGDPDSPSKNGDVSAVYVDDDGVTHHIPDDE